VLKYLRGIMEYGLRYLGDGEVKMQGYSNSDWANNVANKKSTSRFYFSLISAMIYWLSRKETFHST